MGRDGNDARDREPADARHTLRRGAGYLRRKPQTSLPARPHSCSPKPEHSLPGFFTEVRRMLMEVRLLRRPMGRAVTRDGPPNTQWRVHAGFRALPAGFHVGRTRSSLNVARSRHSRNADTRSIRPAVPGPGRNRASPEGRIESAPFVSELGQVTTRKDDFGFPSCAAADGRLLT